MRMLGKEGVAVEETENVGVEMVKSVVRVLKALRRGKVSGPDGVLHTAKNIQW